MKRRIITWLTKKERLEKYPFLRRFFWKRGPIYREMEQRAALMRQKEVITVVFLALDLPCWKCDSVFRLMQKHSRFRPIIWIVPELQIQDDDEKVRKLDEVVDYFETNQYAYVKDCSLEQLRERFNPDIIFLSKPYDGITLWNICDFDRELVCYIPYAFQGAKSDGLLYGGENVVWRNFYTTRSIFKIAQDCMVNAGANIALVGAPMSDVYLYDSYSETSSNVWKTMPVRCTRVIWAPHWSIGNASWFNVSAFLEVAEGMCQIAVKYSDRIQFAFKPHPLLRDTLYQHPEWGKERTDSYYDFWAKLPNSQLETGLYSELFKQSDAMIHDCGSFISEYLLVDKPCMYITRDGAYNGFNDETLQALACYYKGKNVEAVDKFLQRLLSNAPDIMARKRKQFRDKYLVPPHGKSCAENVIECILNG